MNGLAGSADKRPKRHIILTWKICSITKLHGGNRLRRLRVYGNRISHRSTEDGIEKKESVEIGQPYIDGLEQGFSEVQDVSRELYHLLSTSWETKASP